MDNNNEGSNGAVAEEIKKMDFFTRFASVFFSPIKLVKNIREHPVIGAPILAILLLVIISTPLSIKVAKIIMEEQSIIIAERYGSDFLNFTQSAELIDEQQVLMYSTTISTSLASSLASSVVNAVFLIIITKLLKGSGNFKQYFSLFLHISIVVWALSIVSYFFNIMLDSGMTFMSLAPVFMPNGNFTSPMFNVLTAVNIMAIWQTVILYFGIREINSFGKVKSMSIAIFIFIIGVAFTAAANSATVILYDVVNNSLNQI